MSSSIFKKINMYFFDEYKGLPREIYIMAAAAFINCFGEFIALFFSLYLTQMLGYGTAQAGIWVSAMYLSYIPGSIIGGKLCDCRGRKSIMVAGQLAMGVCYIMCGLSITWRYAPVYIIFGKFFDGITDPARESLEADITRPEQRQATFSLIYQVTNISFAVGPFFAAALYTRYPQWLFIGSGILQLIVMWIVILFIKESLPSVTKEFCKKENSPTSSGSVFKALRARPYLLWFSLGLFICTFSYRQISFSLPLQLQREFQGTGPVVFSTVISINSFIVLFFNPLVLKWCKRHSVINNLIIAAAIYAGAFTLFAFAHIRLVFYFLTMFYTVGELLLSNNDRVYRLNNTPAVFRGRFSAILKLFKTAGRLTAPLAGGFLLKAVTFQLFWISIGCFTAVAVICFIHLKRYE